jgi:hypothetical protein
MFVYCLNEPNRELTSSEFRALFQKEAATIFARYTCMQNVSPTMATDCCRLQPYLLATLVCRISAQQWPRIVVSMDYSCITFYMAQIGLIGQLKLPTFLFVMVFFKGLAQGRSVMNCVKK